MKIDQRQMQEIEERKKITILDGAMGTMLQKKGLKLGERPEIFGAEHPGIVEDIHKSYIAAGSRVIYANTFGANSHTLKGTAYSPKEVIEANVKAAKRAASSFKEEKVKVALDLGPLGVLMEPLGPLSFKEAYEIFKESAVFGFKAGADLAVIETMSDLNEARAALLAVKENTDLPVWVTMSFEENGRTFTGTAVSSMALTLEGLGADAIGINCSLGPEEICPLMKELEEWSSLPLIVKPNAGLPDPATGAYTMDPLEFARQMERYADLDIACMGGCCGTSPEFIRELSLKVREWDVSGRRAPERPPKRNGVCCAGKAVEFKGVKVIGERINPTGKKRLAQALKEKDLDYIMKQAIEQQEAGADILDINVGVPGIDEEEMMEETVKAVQSVVSLPLQIDSSNPSAIEAGLRACCGKALVNSVNGEKEKSDAILPIVKKYGAAVVGLTIDEDGIPESCEKRFEIAEHIMNEALSYGIKKEDMAIDCLTLTVSAQQDQAFETLKAARRVKEELGLHGVLGVSNISFGLPERINITTAFLTLAMEAGVDLPIVNPNSQPIMDTVYSYRALSGEDASCLKYIERFASRKEEKVQASEPVGGTEEKKQEKALKMDLETAVLKGLGKETKAQVQILLKDKTEMEVINEDLIPALDLVGVKYEKGELFLPQLINSAGAACEGFDLIKERISQRGGESVNKGTIILATVEGDIHDIGKNIVKVVLENYGFRVIDLGKDVPVQKVVDEAVQNDVKLVGLSALMTTTVESMKRTIAALRASGHECKVMVGGAVLTAEYAKEIGADFYAKDAKASADYAREVFSSGSGKGEK